MSATSPADSESHRPSPTKRALRALREMEARLHALERARSEPIAIIGMGCRFPGGADSPETFWNLLRDGVDAIVEIPAERWDVDGFYDPDPEAAGKMYFRHGGFLDEVNTFDGDFFGIPPREARSLDPQQRLVLEVSWEALENAGIAALRLSESATGVYMGMMTNDYSRLQSALDPNDLDPYVGSGTDFSFAAGRLSYFLGLQGPSMVVDTACSSSLVAIHLACQALRGEECDLALAGGVNLILSPDLNVVLSRMRAAAPDGRCKTFDAAADGYGRGEGCGVVVLKRLSDALAAGDSVLATIRGSAVNHDGPSGGLTVPNGPAQERLLRRALKAAAVDPRDVSYVEAHGTGTSLGDPIEVCALGEVLGRSRTRPLLIGSVKTNFGHLEAAAGMAGLIKVVLALAHREIPPHLHLKEPNPHIPWAEMPIEVPTEPTPWPAGDDQRRIAGVSSFGLSGINAHVIVEEAPAQELVRQQPDRPLHLLTLSAKTEETLKQSAARYERALGDDLAIEDVCFTANAGRSHFPFRLGLVAASTAEAREKLAAFTAGRDAAGLAVGSTRSSDRPRVAFLFSGSEGQYAGMGRQLYETQPTFRAILDRCDALLRADPEKSLIEVQPSRDPISYSHPALFALQTALAELWRSWGIEPDVVMGHSTGEYAAACVAGVFSLEDGLKLVAERARLIDAFIPEGEMVALLADEPQVLAAIEPYAGDISLAAVNAPGVFVISGGKQAMREVCAALAAAGVKTRNLGVTRPFHSALVEPMLADFERFASRATYSLPRTEIISTVTGGPGTSEIADPGYWIRQVRQPVRFVAGMKTLEQQRYEVLIEIGPTPALLALTQMYLGERQGDWLPSLLPSLRPGYPDWQQLLESLQQLYVHGMPIDWSGFDRDYARRRVVLPTYPFQRRRYWLKTAARRQRATPSVGGAELDAHALADFYDVMSSTAIDDGADRFGDGFLTYAPFPEIVPGFSWVRAACDPQGNQEHYRLLVNAQKEMRSILFRNVDFSRCRTVLDFGCGYGSDLIDLAEKYHHLECCGYTLSSRQAERGNLAACRRNLQDRLVIFKRDSTKDDIDDQYDLALGFEVVAHIQDKQALFSNLSSHLREDGTLLLADFISLAPFAVDHDQASSYLITADEWNQCLSRHHLRIAECIDASHEIANFFHDPDFEKNLAALEEIDQSEKMKPFLLAFSQMGQLLRRKLVRYVLLTVRKEGCRSKDEIHQINQSALSSPVPYSEIALSSWLYELVWKPREVRAAAGRSVPPPASWLVFSDHAEGAQGLMDLLVEHGERPVLVVPGDEYISLGVGTWSLDLTRSEDLDRLLREAVPATAPPLKGVIYRLSSAVAKRITGASVQRAQVEYCEGVLRLVQALARLPASPLPRLWLATRGTVPLPDDPEPPNVAQATLWGMARTIALEQPQVWGGILDLPAQPMEGEAAAVLALLRRSDAEDQVCVRDGRHYVPRLIRKRRPEAAEIALRPDGSYLVTGGLGALGLVIGRWLVACGARHLVLVGRRGASTQAAREAVRELEQMGCQVVVAQADVAKRAEMMRVLAQINSSAFALRGVFHLAGTSGAQTLTAMQPETLHSVLRPKVLGTRLLHELTLNNRLDFFVSFSSLSSLLGLKQQAHYSAANHFLDVFAHYRRRLGLPALSINWGRWPGGMVSAETGALLDRIGVEMLPPAQAVEALNLLLGSDTVQAAVCNVHWTVFKEFYEAAAPRPLLEKIEVPSPQSLDREAVPQVVLLRNLAQATPHDREELLIAYLQEKVADVLGFEPDRIPDPQRGFFDMGMDSLMAVELRRRLAVDLDIFLPPTLVFKYPNVEELSAYLLRHLEEKELSAKRGRALRQSPMGPDATSSEIEQLSDQEIDAAIVENLQSLTTMLDEVE